MSTLYSQGASLGNKHKQKDLPKNNKECNLPYLAVGVNCKPVHYGTRGIWFSNCADKFVSDMQFYMGPVNVYSKGTH